MANQMAALNDRIRSVQSTHKIVKAMSLVATAKLQKSRQRVAQNNIYSGYFEQVLQRVVSQNPDIEQTSIYFKPVVTNNPLHIIITSNSGLCGSYNEELLRYVAKNISKDEPIFAIGSYGIKRLMHDNYMLVKQYDKLENIDPETMSVLIYGILTLYTHNEISAIDIVYTHYVNTLTFTPSRLALLPLTPIVTKQNDELLFEPDKQAVLDNLVPLYVSSMVYNMLLESKISEHAARRAAMENANTNAEQLTDELLLQRNQARQEAITQQVTEITSGSVRR